MTDHQLLIIAVIGIGLLATLLAIFILVYLLAVDLLSRASESHPHRRPHTDLPLGLRQLDPTPAPSRRTITHRDSLAVDSNVCAFPPNAHGSHDMPVSAWGHPAPRGVREVEAGELPHQLWTGRLR